MGHDLPRIIAHRGASHAAPENTLIAIECAYHEKARWVEIDVKLTADRVPVLMHDDTLNRTTDGTGPVVVQPLDRLRTLDAGGWHGAAYAGERIAILRDALEMCGARSLGINIEIKPNPGEAEATVARVLEILNAVPEHRQPGILFSSFSQQALIALLERAPLIPRGLLLDGADGDWLCRARACKAWSINVDGNRLTFDQARAIKMKSYPLLAYTIDDPVRAGTLFSWGVDAIFTNKPGLMIDRFGP